MLVARQAARIEVISWLRVGCRLCRLLCHMPYFGSDQQRPMGLGMSFAVWPEGLHIDSDSLQSLRCKEHCHPEFTYTARYKFVPSSTTRCMSCIMVRRLSAKLQPLDLACTNDQIERVLFQKWRMYRWISNIQNLRQVPLH